jgi:peptidoglycan/xylan/chitin deacetylase (PgdA/CDA1 family)
MTTPLNPQSPLPSLPRPRWPGGARCVVALTVDFDGTGNEIGLGFDPAGVRSAGGYSARRGIPRILDILARHDIRATFFVPGFDAETNPDLVRRIVAERHEIGAHGYLHERWPVQPDEEEALLRKAHAILADISGTVPRGWRSPGGQKNDRTMAVLRDLGYCFDSSDKDDDSPYLLREDTEPSRRILEIPNNTSSLDDHPFYNELAGTPREVLDVWQGEFETLYRDTGYFMLTVHPRAGFGSGQPSRARVIEHLIQYIKRFPDVRFVQLTELAEWCLDPANGFVPEHGQREVRA